MAFHCNEAVTFVQVSVSLCSLLLKKTFSGTFVNRGCKKISNSKIAYSANVLERVCMCRKGMTPMYHDLSSKE